MNRNKILVVDDDQEIWPAYSAVLAPGPRPRSEVEQLADLLSQNEQTSANSEFLPNYELTFMPQGKEAFEHVVEQQVLCQLYSVAFIDIRMPPGWDGVKTAKKIVEVDPDIEIVIVTAYTDVSRSQIIEEIGRPEKILYLRKPFDREELSQIALQLSTKWQLYRQEKQQKKNIEKLLHENQQVRTYLDGIINSMPSMLIGVSGEGWITHWNEQVEKFTGISKDKVLNQSIDEVLPELDGISYLVYRSAIQTTIEKKEKFAFKFKDSAILCDIIIYPISVTEETSTLKNSAVIRIDDITERVKLQEIMLQSDKMLTVGGLAAGMAHEINTPLGSIIQNAQVISNRIAPDNKKNQAQAEACGTSIEVIHKYLNEREIIKLVEGIWDCGKRTSKIVKSMLSFSHQGTSRIKENLAELITEAIDLSRNDYEMKKRYRFRDFDIQTDFDETLPAVVCERTKIEQVIMNLLKNAAQSMLEMPETHKPQISIVARQDKQFARIEVQDNGPGIRQEDQKRIFDPFFTTKEVGVGTGLGLSLAYFIITKNHNGIIQVKSELGKGTCFIIQIPLH